MKTEYRPNPLDTSRVELPKDLLPLVEDMARNVHEIWARNRMAEDWTYGPKRNDEVKEHPCLVPYGDLPESEREYDRATAIETLKLILHLGFEIKKRDGTEDRVEVEKEDN